MLAVVAVIVAAATPFAGAQPGGAAPGQQATRVLAVGGSPPNVVGFGQGRSGQAGGQAGGGANADFDTLIDLIQATVAPDSWDDVGGEGSIESFPGGVYVDPRGVLRSLSQPINTSSNLPTAAARRQQLSQQLERQFSKWNASRVARLRSSPVGNSARFRAVSIRDLLDSMLEQPVSDDQRFIAGLYRIDYLVVDHEGGDVVLVGPAGPWKLDAAGRRVNVKTGRPVLRADDLIVLLRNAVNANGQFMCAITPTRQGLASAQAFAGSAAPVRAGERGRWLEDFRSAVGLQAVEVTGIEANSRVARVIVEADQHMKQIGIGLVVPKPVAQLENVEPILESYLDRVVASGEVPERMDVLRWWFTLHPNALVAFEQDSVYGFGRQAVQVLSENELLTRLGERIHTGASSSLNEAFAKDFTAAFPKLSKLYPTYADLDNVFRLAMATSLIQHLELPAQMQWPLDEWCDPQANPTAVGRVPKWVESIVNFREVSSRRFVASVSGGVQFESGRVRPGSLDELDAAVQARARKTPARLRSAIAAAGTEGWWWDLHVGPNRAGGPPTQ